MADWGVDALLQIQTRQHKDVDIVVCVADVPKLRELLSERGVSFKGGDPPNSFVLSDGAGLEIDIHAVAFNSTGQSDQPVRDFGEFSGLEILSPSAVSRSRNSLVHTIAATTESGCGENQLRPETAG